MTSNLITTVIPTYRRPILLRRAIQSVLDQTYPHFQICVYDNASNDSTGEVVNAFARRDPRVRYYCHPKNIGSQENFSFGLSQVDTPFFDFLSDDDFLLPDFFAKALSALSKSPEAAFFSGGLLQADTEGRVVGFPRYGAPVEQAHPPSRLFHLLAPYTRTWTSILFRRAMVESLGGLKKDIAYSFPVDLLLRCATRYQAVLSDTPCAIFTVHPASISTAESSRIFESLLNLALFDSVNQAIDSARKDNIVSADDAAVMKARYRDLTEWNFLRNSLGLIARGHVSIATRASEVLAQAFKRKDMAAVIRFAAKDDTTGAFLRLTIRGIRAARKPWSVGNSSGRYSAYSEVVKNRMLELNA